MNQINYIKKVNSTNSLSTAHLPLYHKVPKDENAFKNNLNIQNNKPPVSQREFGKDLTHLNYNQNSNGTKERKSANNSNKLLQYFRPLKKEKDDKKNKKNDNSLHNLRSKASNNSKNSSNNNSFNNENVNILNTDGNVNRGKIKIIENIEINNGIDVEIVIEKENYNSLGKANNTPVTLDISYKPCNNNLKQNGQILNNKYINQNFLFKNPQIPFDYLDDIYEHLKATEYDLLPKYGYMKEQKDLNEKMRAILIDWLVDVHLKFELLPETLFLTTQLIDRFLGKKEINRNRLQLVGVTALYIACKYEEIYPPELKDFVYITDKAYTKADILSMEYEILNELNFSITQPSTLLFLQVLVEISQLKFDENIFLFARYLLELYLIEYRMIKYPPSWIAAATLYITIRVKKLNSYHKKIDIPKITGYNEEKLKECARDICIILDNAEKSSLQAVKIKYSSSKFLEVAKWKKN